MNCEAVVNIEDLYTEGRLSPSRKAQVRAHLQGCASCAGKLEKPDLFAGLKRESAPRELKERMKKLLRKIEAAEPAPVHEPLSLDSEMWPVVASVALYLGLALLLAWTGPGVTSQRFETPSAEVRP